MNFVVKRVLWGVTIFYLFLSEVSFASTLDLTTAGASGIINNAIFQQLNSDNSSGTGVFESFVRIQATGIESGYNTDGTLEFDAKIGSWTHSLLLSAVPIVNINGTAYREFCLDLNESEKNISLDELKIHIESSANLTGYPSIFSAAIYDLDAGGDNWVKMDYSLNSGSGHGDIAVLVPSILFGTDTSKYVYLYSKLGVNQATDNGFEEWGVGANAEPIIPEPATILLLGLGAMILRRKR